MTKLFLSTSTWLLELLLCAVAYGVLFFCNAWLTSSLVFGIGVSWIYLPAGLRLFLTLICGFPGALGIAIASFLISFYGEFPQDLTVCIGIGLISGFAPYLARLFVLKNIQLESDLSNLNLPKLLICILIYALLSASLHQWWFATMGLENTGTVNHFAVMLLGDIFGSLLLIACIKTSLDLLKKLRRTAH